MYKLPELPYFYQDLEPFIDTHTIGLHYHKHEKNYLNQLNALLVKNNYNYQYGLEELIYHINEFPVEDREDILFNLGGVLNHNLYFKSMSPGGFMPVGKLKDYIDRKYGSYDEFFEEIKKKGMNLKGSGYTFFVLKNNGDLDIINMSNQDTPLLFGYIPLFTIDLWEHAYYINYENRKSDYLDNFKNIADFSYASRIFNSIIK